MKKTRKPGGGRKKLKPEYNAGKNLKEQMESTVALYNSEMSLQAIGDALALNPIKVRKLLITAGVYESEVAEKVKNTFEEYRETKDYKTSILSTANTLKLSKASVTSYLPYKKGVYFPSIAEKEKISVGAERQRRYRAVKKLRTEPTEENLWEVVLLYQSSTVLDEPEREAGTTSIPIPQREESENTPSPDLPGQLENVQQSGNEIAERGMPI